VAKVGEKLPKCIDRVTPKTPPLDDATLTAFLDYDTNTDSFLMEVDADVMHVFLLVWKPCFEKQKTTGLPRISRIDCTWLGLRLFHSFTVIVDTHFQRRIQSDLRLEVAAGIIAS